MIMAMIPLLFVSCDIFDGNFWGNNETDSPKNNSDKNPDSDDDKLDGGSGISLGTTVNGKVTWYEGYDAESVAYYAPEIENDWYKCAVSENKLSEFPPQSAAEIAYNGKKIRVLVTDLCPNSKNSKWTSQSDYYFDLGKNAFAALGNTTGGVLNVSITKFAYQTTKNIRFQEKPSNGNGYYLAGRFYNMRHPLKKVEISTDGKTFTQMTRMDGNKNNWWKIDGNGNLNSASFYFRLTDEYGHVITSSSAMTFSAAEGSNGIGTNFPY